MISIVCVFNDRSVLDGWLLKSLRRQTAPYELHLIDNTDNARFTSAAEALNHGARNATGDYIMFVHQDVYLISPDWLESVEETLKALPNLGVAGPAGKLKKGLYSYSNSEHTPTPTPACRQTLTEPMVVQTLDEMLAIMPREMFQKHLFNEVLCPDWHMYVVEYCLRIKRDMGLNAYVFPKPIYHWVGMPKPLGLTAGYFRTLRLVLPNFKEHRHIATTCGDWSTRLPISWQRWRGWRVVWKIRPFMHGGNQPARALAFLTVTKPILPIIKRIVLEVNANRLFEVSRRVTYELWRDALKPQTRLELGKLTPTEINEHLVTLQMLTRELELKRVLELGVCTGQSTLAFLNAVKDIDGYVTSMDIEDCPIAREAVADEGLDDWWTFIEQDDMMHPWRDEIDHLFIDTSHAYHHTYEELEKYEPFVRPGGVITMHDIVTFPGVKRAIDEYLEDRPYLRFYSYYTNNGLGVIFKDGRGARA